VWRAAFHANVIHGARGAADRFRLGKKRATGCRAAPEPAGRGFVRRISGWSERWTPLLERGAAGTLQTAEVAATRSQEDPDAMPSAAALPR